MGAVKKTVYILFNELDSRWRFKATRFVQDQGFVPTYPTIVTDFFESIESKRAQASDLIRKCDEVWIFGKVNASMHEQMVTARNMEKIVKFFTVYKGEFLEDNAEPVTA